MFLYLFRFFFFFFYQLWTTHLLSFGRRAAQQHVEQHMRQQVDGHLVVVVDDETAAGEHPAGQIVSHLTTPPAKKSS